MLEQLDEVAWASLSHAYGAAEDVPELIRALASPDRALREGARSELYGSIFHQGTRWEATSYAVPFLLELCAVPAMPDRHALVEMVVAFAIGFEETWLPHGVRTRAWREELAGATGDYADALRWELDAYDAVRDGLPVFRDLLADGDVRVVTSAAYALGWFPDERESSIAALAGRLADGLAPDAAATACIALGLLDADRALVEDCVRAEEAVGRIGAAIALARLCPHDLPGRAVDELAYAAANNVRADGVLFFAGDLGVYAALSLASLPVDVAERAVDAMLAGLQHVSFPRTAPFGDAILRIAFRDTVEPTRYESLSALQQRVVRAIAKAQRAWAPFGANTADTYFSAVLRSYGLPDDFDVMRAFAGLPPRASA